MLDILLSVLMLEVVTVGLSDSVKLHYCTRQLLVRGTQNLGIQSAAGIDNYRLMVDGLCCYWLVINLCGASL